MSARVAVPALVVGAVAVASASVATAIDLEMVETAAGATEAAERSGNATQQRPPLPGPETARYRVTIVQQWDGSTHPGTLPPNPHTSPAVLAAHGRAGDVFAVGSLASPGIEIMAERGGTNTLRAELNANPTVTDVDTGRGIDTDDTPNTDQLEVDVSRDAGFISLVTMLAPSPDWFIGFSGFSAYTGGGWVERVEIPLGSYDAGTDSGVGFTSGDIDTQPRVPVSGPRDAPFIAAAGQNPFAFAIIERIG